MDLLPWNLSQLSQFLRVLLDLTILSALSYRFYIALDKTRSVALFRGILTMAGLYLISYLFKLETMLWIMDSLAPGLVIGLAIVFQPELRNMFEQIGLRNSSKSSKRGNLDELESILIAAEILMTHKKGMLAVFSRKISLKNIIETGTILNAELSSNLILTIFRHETALHDGAMIIENGKIVASGCLLPLSKREELNSLFGTRHRAGLGLTEETDAVVLIVSEETGALSLAIDGQLQYDLSLEDVRIKLIGSLYRTQSQIRGAGA